MLHGMRPGRVDPRGSLSLRVLTGRSRGTPGRISRHFQRLSSGQMVTLSRLDRPDNPYGHITENQHLEGLDKPGLLLNPLHTTVLATRLQDGVRFEDIAERFGPSRSSCLKKVGSLIAKAMMGYADSIRGRTTSADSRWRPDVRGRLRVMGEAYSRASTVDGC